jgi:hypothetical protein
MLELIVEKIPNATVISVGHRPELEAFHGRKLELEHKPGGARIIGDTNLTILPGRGVRLFRRLFGWGQKEEAPASPSEATKPAKEVRSAEAAAAKTDDDREKSSGDDRPEIDQTERAAKAERAAEKEGDGKRKEAAPLDT